MTKETRPGYPDELMSDRPMYIGLICGEVFLFIVFGIVLGLIYKCYIRKEIPRDPNEMRMPRPPQSQSSPFPPQFMIMPPGQNPPPPPQ
jgi:hypothetical protein